MGKRTRKDSSVPKAAKKESAALFSFARTLLAEDSGIDNAELVRDQHVCGLIYEQYPYGSLWKVGDKDVGTAVEMDLLARNLGVPQKWIYDLLEGIVSENDLLERYRKLKDDHAHAMVLECGGGDGFVQAEVRIGHSDPQRAAVFSQLLQSMLADMVSAPDPDVGG